MIVNNATCFYISICNELLQSDIESKHFNLFLISQYFTHVIYIALILFRKCSNFHKFPLFSDIGKGLLDSKVLLYLIIGACLVTVLTTIFVLAFICHRRRSTISSPDPSKVAYLKRNLAVKPPDLWIHHDQMELKALEKSHPNNDGAGSSGATTLVRNSEFDSQDNLPSTNSLDKRSYNPNVYMGT